MASEWFGGQVSILNEPSATVAQAAVAPPPPLSPPTSPALAISLGAVGGLAVLLVLLAASLRWWRRRQQREQAEREASEARSAKLITEPEERAQECTFWWVNAEALTKSDEVSLPHFQALRKKTTKWGAPFLKQHKVTWRGVIHGEYASGSFLTISHRWLGDPKVKDAPPDPTGTQLRAIRNYLRAHPEIKWVWFE